MKRSEGIAYLMSDGDNYVPCSRYGRHTSDCAPVAWRFAYLVARESHQPLDTDLLDWAMGLVVNDHDDVRHFIREYGYRHYF
jgi:hypothetical protein